MAKDFRRKNQAAEGYSQPDEFDFAGETAPFDPIVVENQDQLAKWDQLIQAKKMQQAQEQAMSMTNPMQPFTGMGSQVAGGAEAVGGYLRDNAIDWYNNSLAKPVVEGVQNLQAGGNWFDSEKERKRRIERTADRRAKLQLIKAPKRKT